MYCICKDKVQIIKDIQNVAISVLLELFLDTVYTARLRNDRIVVGIA